MATIVKKKGQISGTQHPEHKRHAKDWTLWRQAYEGGPEFVEAVLKRYSRRENFLDFKERLELAFNPAHVTKALNRYRNAILSAMGEVKREGDPTYTDWCKTNVDLKKSSMTAFMGLQFLPLLMAQGKRFIVMDAPPKGETESRADDPALPWVWCVDATAVKSWSYDADGCLKAIAILEDVDEEDPLSGLVTSCCSRTRYYRLLETAEDTFTPTEKGMTPVQGPGVLLRFLDKEDKDLQQPVVLQDFTRLPVVESRLIQALCKDVAGHAKALVNLNSTDVNFLFRGNFPLFTKQRDTSKGGIKPVNKHNAVQPGRETETMDRTVDGEDNRPSSEVGSNKGMYYDMKAERPDWVGPSTENLKASMEKQKEVRDEIDQLLDLSMASQSKGKLQQSGESKKADRVDLDAGLGYIGQVMETAEREVAEVFHFFQGSAVDWSVKYPATYSIKTEEERIADANALFAVADKVYEPIAQAELHKRGAEILLGTLVDSATLDKIMAAIDKRVSDGTWFDTNLDRATAIQADVLNGIGSKAGAARRRWIPEDEATEAQDEANAKADALLGGPLGDKPPEIDPLTGKPVVLDPNAPPTPNDGSGTPPEGGFPPKPKDPIPAPPGGVQPKTGKTPPPFK